MINRKTKKKTRTKKSFSKRIPFTALSSHRGASAQQFIHYTIPGKSFKLNTKPDEKRPDQAEKGNIIIHKFVWLQPIKIHFSTLKSCALTLPPDACRSRLSDSPILNTTKRNEISKIEKEDFSVLISSIQTITTGFLFQLEIMGEKKNEK